MSCRASSRYLVSSFSIASARFSFASVGGLSYGRAHREALFARRKANAAPAEAVGRVISVFSDRDEVRSPKRLLGLPVDPALTPARRLKQPFHFICETGTGRLMADQMMPDGKRRGGFARLAAV